MGCFSGRTERLTVYKDESSPQKKQNQPPTLNTNHGNISSTPITASISPNPYSVGILKNQPKQQDKPEYHNYSSVASQALKRLAREKKDILKRPSAQYKLDQEHTRDFKWIFIMEMPPTCPFKKKKFRAIVQIPEDYPNSPPHIVVEKPYLFFHPNINDSGLICEKIVNENRTATKIRERMDSFVQLLRVPNPHDAWNADAAKLYLKDQNEYFRQAQYKFRGVNQTASMI